MRIIEPSAELWQEKTMWEQVARCARLCYAAESGRKTAAELCEMLTERGHLSMFRHGSHYYVLPVKKRSRDLIWALSLMKNSPYVSITTLRDRQDAKLRTYWISLNHQFAIEHQRLIQLLNDYEVSAEQFAALAADNHFCQPLTQLRYTVMVTTQISTSRELNRVSPNNIAEQSTRYVNFVKKLGVQIARPWWYSNTLPLWKRWVFRTMFRIESAFYGLALRLGLKPQDAREYLPLATATRVAYTYTLYEWKHIFRLRILGDTGTPHPNAYTAACAIRDAILPQAKVYGGAATDIMPQPREQNPKTIVFD